MSAGIGALSGLGVAVEAVPGTGETTADFYLPILSESITANRESVPSGSIVGDSMVAAVGLGISTVEGGMSMEIEGSVSGQAIYLWNGPDGYTPTTVGATLGKSTAAPTGTPGAGGTLAAGAYKYKVATLLLRTVDGKILIMPASANSAAITTSSGNLTNTINWTNPSAFPSGFTHYGTILYRTLAAGADDSQVFLKVVVGTGASTTDDGSVALTSSVTPFTTAMYRHEFIGSPPVTGDRLDPFSVLVFKDNDSSERYVQCRMDTMKLAVGGPNEKLLGDFTLKGTKAEAISNFSPVFVPLEPFVGWHAAIKLDGTLDCTLESFELNCNNNVNPVPGLCAVPFNRDVISGKREITGSFNRQFETHTYWTKMLAGTEFALNFTSYGESIITTTGHSLSVGGAGNIDAVPFQFFIEIDLFRCRCSKAGGNISGPDRIVETVEFTAFKSATYSTEMRIRIYNTTALYA